MEEAKGVKVESVSFLMGQGALVCFVKALTSWKKSVILTNVQVNKNLFTDYVLRFIDPTANFVRVFGSYSRLVFKDQIYC